MGRSGFDEKKISDYEQKVKFVHLFFVQGWFGILAALEWSIFRAVNLWMTIGMPPVSRQGLPKPATKSTDLACEKLMIAAEALGLSSCPMEGFAPRRLSRLLRLSPAHHEITMVIIFGKKSPDRIEQPQWRRRLESTVTVL